MWAEGGRGAAIHRPQCLPSTSEGPKGETPRDFHCKPWADRPGTALRAKTEVSRGVYILGTRRIDFYNVGIREPRMPKYHQMLLGKIVGEGVRNNLKFYKYQFTWPITAVKEDTGQDGDSHFNDLKRRVKKPSQKGRTMMAP